MSYRTTDALVQGIIETDNSTDLEPFILSANELVTEICGSSGYTATRLELIERWLSAHFYAIFDNRIAQETAGPVQATHQYKVDLNLNVTIYGQQVLLLDTKGGFAALQKQASSGVGRPTVFWMGANKATLEADGVVYDA